MAEENQSLPLDPNNQRFEVNHEKEVEWMFHFTSTITRELTFAIDLMEYSLRLSYLQLPACAFPNCCRRDHRTDFDDLLKRFVDLYMPFVPILGRFPLMDQMDRVEYETFKRYMNCFGFDSERLFRQLRVQNLGVQDRRLQASSVAFWRFCLETVQYSIHAYQHGMGNAPHFGIMIICRTLSHFYMINYLFDERSRFDYIRHMAYDLLEGLEPRTDGRSI